MLQIFSKKGQRMNDNPCCQSMIQTFLIIFNCIAFVRSFNHDLFNVFVPWRYWISIKSLLSTHYLFLLSIQTLFKQGSLKIKLGYIFSIFLPLSLQVEELLLLSSMLFLETASPSSDSPFIVIYIHNKTKSWIGVSFVKLFVNSVLLYARTKSTSSD